MAAVAAMTNDNGKSKTTATSNRPGINSDPPDTWAIRANLTSIQRAERRVPLLLFAARSLISSVLRREISLRASPVSKRRGLGSQASSVIRRRPATAVSGIWTCGCRYPILHLCHSAPTDQQSNFTQARSEGGDADAGMRIYASTKTRSCLKWLEGWWSAGTRRGWRIRWKQ